MHRTDIHHKGLPAPNVIIVKPFSVSFPFSVPSLPSLGPLPGCNDFASAAIVPLYPRMSALSSLSSSQSFRDSSGGEQGWEVAEGAEGSVEGRVQEPSALSHGH